MQRASELIIDSNSDFDAIGKQDITSSEDEAAYWRKEEKLMVLNLLDSQDRVDKRLLKLIRLRHTGLLKYEQPMMFDD